MSELRNKLENYVRSNYSDVRIWDYAELNGTVYLRFTANTTLYLLTHLKAGSHLEVFKLERNELI